jgi:hypothetical protein
MTSNVDTRIGIDTLQQELDRQVRTLLDKGYPQLAGLTEDGLLARVEELRPLLSRVRVSDASHLPFVVVVRDSLVPTVAAVERFDVRGEPGWTDMAEELPGFRAIDGVDVPDAACYLLVDVSTGPETLGVRPGDALPMIRERGRSPLTIDEGVAVVTQFPEVFAERNAFQALGSRAGNKRVPSFWVSKGAPRLGWCWEGNPHTWLGSGSSAARLAPVPPV